MTSASACTGFFASFLAFVCAFVSRRAGTEDSARLLHLSATESEPWSACRRLSCVAFAGTGGEVVEGSLTGLLQAPLFVSMASSFSSSSCSSSSSRAGGDASFTSASFSTDCTCGAVAVPVEAAFWRGPCVGCLKVLSRFFFCGFVGAGGEPSSSRSSASTANSLLNGSSSGTGASSADWVEGSFAIAGATLAGFPCCSRRVFSRSAIFRCRRCF
mmetsp:Transcript_44326/g.104952  ORF Transcript_44326/g.104952 Transcript_44326/m.104952 type:complete len:215 (+) Transcript_44326:1416-2060(+)